MKNKIVILLLVLSAGWFQLLPAHAQVAGTSLNLGEFNNALSLFDKAVSLKVNGQTIKARRKGLEALRLFDQLFKKNMLITTTKECAFRRIKNQLDNDRYFTREFGLACLFNYSSMWSDVENPRLRFKFISSIDRYKSKFDKNSWTASNITEAFEASEFFTGTIKVVSVSNNTHFLNSSYGDNLIIVNCKILNLNPIDQPPSVEKVNNINSDDTPGNVLQKLESGQDVPKETIIKVLRSLIDEGK